MGNAEQYHSQAYSCIWERLRKFAASYFYDRPGQYEENPCYDREPMRSRVEMFFAVHPLEIVGDRRHGHLTAQLYAWGILDGQAKGYAGIIDGELTRLTQ